MPNRLFYRRMIRVVAATRCQYEARKKMECSNSLRFHPVRFNAKMYSDIAIKYDQTDLSPAMFSTKSSAMRLLSIWRPINTINFVMVASMVMSPALMAPAS